MTPPSRSGPLRRGTRNLKGRTGQGNATTLYSLFTIRALPEIGVGLLLMILMWFTLIRIVHPGPVRTIHLDAAAEPDRINAGAQADLGISARARASRGQSTEIPERDPHAGLVEELTRLAGSVGGEAQELFRIKIRQWAEASPSAAAAWGVALKNEPARRDALEQIAIAWANVDLESATKWTGSLVEGDAKKAAVLALANEAARSTPLVAIEAVAQLPPTHERDEALAHAVSQWSAVDPVSASAWSTQVADPLLRQRLLSAVAIEAAESSPMAAADLTATMLDPGTRQAEAAVSIVERWAQTDPQAAADWVLRFPDTPARPAAITSLVSVWATRDASGAEKWVEALPEGVLREDALTAYRSTVTPSKSPLPSDAPSTGGK
jgi:hypothetical protein